MVFPPNKGYRLQSKIPEKNETAGTLQINLLRFDAASFI
jgi:hypothetical protein